LVPLAVEGLVAVAVRQMTRDWFCCVLPPAATQAPVAFD